MTVTSVWPHDVYRVTEKKINISQELEHLSSLFLDLILHFRTQPGPGKRRGHCINLPMSFLTGMFDRWLPVEKSKYVRVDSSDNRNRDEASQSSHNQLAFRVIEAPFDIRTVFLVCLMIAVSAGSLGFFAGRHLPPLSSSDFLPGNILDPSIQIMTCLLTCQ